MKFDSKVVRAALLGAGLVLGLSQTASAGVIKKTDPCRTPLPGFGTHWAGGYGKKAPRVINGSGRYAPRVPNGVVCLPRQPRTKCPPILVNVLGRLNGLNRCAPPRPVCIPTTNDVFRAPKKVACYVPAPKKVVRKFVHKPRLVRCVIKAPRVCKPIFNGGVNGSTNGSIYCPPSKPTNGGGYNGGGGNPTPEPSSIALAAMGAGALARMRRRRAAARAEAAARA